MDAGRPVRRELDILAGQPVSQTAQRSPTY